MTIIDEFIEIARKHQFYQYESNNHSIHQKVLIQPSRLLLRRNVQCLGRRATLVLQKTEYQVITPKWKM